MSSHRIPSEALEKMGNGCSVGSAQGTLEAEGCMEISIQVPLFDFSMRIVVTSRTTVKSVKEDAARESSAHTSDGSPLPWRSIRLKNLVNMELGGFRPSLQDMVLHLLTVKGVKEEEQREFVADRTCCSPQIQETLACAMRECGIEEEAIRLFFLTTPWQYQPIYGEANHVFDWFDGLRCRLLNAKGFEGSRLDEACLTLGEYGVEHGNVFYLTIFLQGGGPPSSLVMATKLLVLGNLGGALIDVVSSQANTKNAYDKRQEARHEVRIWWLEARKKNPKWADRVYRHEIQQINDWTSHLLRHPTKPYEGALFTARIAYGFRSMERALQAWFGRK